MSIQSVLITGAGSGIGRALSLEYAADGCALYLCDRDESGLAITGEACSTAGVKVVLRAIDVTDEAAMAEWVKSCTPLDLVITCAGVQFTSLTGLPETAEQVRTTLAVNFSGTLNAVMPAIEIMQKQAPNADGIRGQIAAMASLGAFVSVPGASAYCASKAAVDSWIVGRSALARKDGIWLTSICPGYVRTPLTAINGFDMHGLMEPLDAARIIKRRLRKKPVRLAFPLRMVAAAKLGGLLPAGFPARMLARNQARKLAKNG